jgi:Na+/serine symporter
MLFKCCSYAGLFGTLKMSEFAACVVITVLFLVMAGLTWFAKKQRDKIREIEKKIKDDSANFERGY